MIYLLDTDIVIHLVRGLKNPKKVAENRRAVRLEERCRREKKSGNEIGISAISASELEFGARASENYSSEVTALKFLAPFEIYDYRGQKGPVFYGQIRQTLERIGKPIGAMYLLIAAHAMALDATLVTNNVSEFQRVPGLSVVNWWQ